MPAGSQSPHSMRIVDVAVRLIAPPSLAAGLPAAGDRRTVASGVQYCHAGDEIIELLARPTKLAAAQPLARAQPWGRIEDEDARSCGLDGRDRLCAGRLGAGQGSPAQDLAVAPACPSARAGHQGLGRRYREAIGRHDQIDRLSLGTARQGVRSLRHGARRHRRRDLRQSRLPTRPLPADRNRPDSLHLRRRPQGHRRDRRLVSQIRRHRDEGHAFLLRLHPRSRRAAFGAQEGDGAGRSEGHEGAASAEHHRPARHHARRHQRAGLGAGIARHAGARCRRCHHLPVGLDLPLRHRQGGQVPHRRAALYDGLHLFDQPRQISLAVARAEEGDGRSLHRRLGGEDRRPVGGFRACRDREDASGFGPRGLRLDRRSARRMEEDRRALDQELGRGRPQGRRRCRYGDGRAAGRFGEIRRGILNSGPNRESRMNHRFMDRVIDGIELVAAAFVGIVAADIFISVLLRYFFSVSIPDSYDFGRLLLGILIFWGIAATSYRGTHITVDLVWGAVGPRQQRLIDIFATLVLLFVVTVQTATLFDKVRATWADNVLTYDLNLPTWPFFAIAWIGDVSAVLLIAIRTYRLVFQPALIASTFDIKPV